MMQTRRQRRWLSPFSFCFTKKKKMHPRARTTYKQMNMHECMIAAWLAHTDRQADRPTNNHPTSHEDSWIQQRKSNEGEKRGRRLREKRRVRGAGNELRGERRDWQGGRDLSAKQAGQVSGGRRKKVRRRGEREQKRKEKSQ
mmetsp:Transcript_14848/g.29973  ORF Transcript_14848/g.29973 Transcript_14848/m.29973 type:complete len:142 (+) Transcript_14848:308-733(+)